MKTRKPFVFGNDVRKSIGSYRSSPNSNQPKLPNEIKELYTQTTTEKKQRRESIFIWINSFNRPKELNSLLKDIYKNKQNFQITVFVLDDCSSLDYVPILKSFSGKLNIVYHRVDYNHGKKQYWRLCNYALSVIKKEYSDYDYYIKLDDDCRLVENFFVKCVYLWSIIEDKKKICLNFRLDSREGKSVWTRILPRILKFNGIPIYLSQWVDMDFFCTLDMLRVLNFNISEQSIYRWYRNKNASSGTGRDISIRLVQKGYHLYLTTETLVIHDHHDSKMNPDERGKNPLVTKLVRNLNYGMPNEK
jgi:hypothetical protein